MTSLRLVPSRKPTPQPTEAERISAEMADAADARRAEAVLSELTGHYRMMTSKDPGTRSRARFWDLLRRHADAVEEGV